MNLILLTDKVKKSVKNISLAYITFEGINVKKEQPLVLKSYISEVMRDIKCSYNLELLKENEVIRNYRDFYWHHLSIDPTKIRPSSEALIRRILANNPIPKISSIVDLNNWVSIHTLIPLGAYDLEKLSLPLKLRFAKIGEKFEPIGGKMKELKGKEIILTDNTELIIHLYPHRDSNITKITNSTRNMLVVACGVPRVSIEKLKKALELFRNLLEKLSEKPINSSKIISLK